MADLLPPQATPYPDPNSNTTSADSKAAACMSASVAGPVIGTDCSIGRETPKAFLPNHKPPPYTLLLSLMEAPALHAYLAHMWHGPSTTCPQLEAVILTYDKLLLLHLLIKQGAYLVAAVLLRRHLFF